MSADYVHVGRRICHFRYDCRACGSTDLTSVLDLGEQPLANAFVREDQLDENELRLPLHMQRCTRCGLCQLSAVVEPDLLYGPRYAYRSGYSDGWRQHCAALAAEIGTDKLVLDIGCLDGVLLTECLKNGNAVMGIDPSHPVGEYGDYPVLREFFGRDTHAKIAHQDVIVAQNCLGHVDDAKGFLEGIRDVLKPDGVAIIECPWVVPLIRERRWDTIYHEHLSYWGATPLVQLANAIGLRVRRVQNFPDLHGGTLRYYLSLAPSDGLVDLFPGTQSLELNLSDIDYTRFRDSVQCEIQWWAAWFRENHQKVVAGYGASAKSSTFLNALPERPPLVGIFDDNPLKHNLYTPGRHYPVLKPTRMTLRDCEVLINFSPNWPLEEKARALGFTGEVLSTWRR